MNSNYYLKYTSIPNETVISSLLGSNSRTQDTKNNLKGLAASVVLGISLSTIIAPVIHHPPDTVIDFERPYTRQHLATVYDMFLLNNDYIIQNIAEVQEYLSKNMDLRDALKRIASIISKYDGIKSVELEHYHDIEEHWEKLYVLVETELDDMNRLNALEDTLLDAVFEPMFDLLDGRVVLAVS